MNKKMDFQQEMYRTTVKRFTTYFVIIAAIGGLLGGIEGLAPIGIVVGAIIGGIMFLTVALHFLMLAPRHQALAKNAEVMEGQIDTWEPGFYRFTGKIGVRVNGHRFYTPACCSRAEAISAIGRELTFCVVDGVIYIIELGSRPKKEDKYWFEEDR